MRSVWLALPFSLVFYAAIAFVIWTALAQTHNSPPRCTSGISEISATGNKQTQPVTVWYPAGCRH